MLRKLMLLAAMLAMVLGIAVPAVAQVGGSAPPQTTVYVPPQILDAGGHQYRVSSPGGTLACSGAPYTAPSGSCTPLGDRTPDPGLVCDMPAKVLAFGTLPLSAFACHTAAETETTPASTATTPTSTGPGVVNRQFVITDGPDSFNTVTFR
jgi:hypothetical protein